MQFPAGGPVDLSIKLFLLRDKKKCPFGVRGSFWLPGDLTSPAKNSIIRSECHLDELCRKFHPTPDVSMELLVLAFFSGPSVGGGGEKVAQQDIRADIIVQCRYPVIKEAYMWCLVEMVRST